MLPYIYFLKVIICSAIFMGYYFVALRNKIYHQYNRFYLLIATAFSWCIPLLKLDIFIDKPTVSQPIYNAISYISNDGNAFEPEFIVQNTKPVLTVNDYLFFGYLLLSIILLSGMIYSIAKIAFLAKKYPKETINDCDIYFTKAANTPFSFFKLIFWNADIEINSAVGQQILQHELTHIKQKHSWDKVLMQLNIIAGWFNPFFWLIKKELGMIHEFIADKKSVSSASVQEFAAMLLSTAFGTKHIALTNPFFFSPIKRRLVMLTKNKKQKFSYVQRIIALPLLAAAVILFSLKVNAENDKKTSFYKDGGATTLSKKYKVVIDAGHGGDDKGASSADDKVFEKDIALAIAKIIKEKNANDNIEIILTREDDKLINPKERIEFSNTINADLFVSVHCNDANTSLSKNLSGLEFYVVSKEKDNGFKQQSDELANKINNVLSVNFKSNGIRTRQVGIWVLQGTKCPGVLIETGFITNKEDLKLLTHKEKQELMANDILKGIESYLKEKEQ